MTTWQFALTLLFLGQTGDNLRFVQPVVNLGELTSHQTRKHTFAFVNQGPGPLEILAVEPSCGCMVPSLARRVVAQGDRGELVLEVKPTSQPEGSHAWFAKVRYRASGQTHETRVNIQASIRHEVLLQPTVIALHGSGLQQEITITDRRSPAMNVTRVSVSGSLLQARLTGVDKGTTRIVLQSGQVPPGRRDEVLSILTDDPVYSHFDIPVTLVGQVRSRIVASPDRIDWQGKVGQSPPSMLIRVRASGEGAVMLQRVTSADPALTCTWAQGPENAATLKVQVDAAKLGKRNIASTIRVEVRSPVIETLTIPISMTRE